MNALELRRRTLGKGVYKKTVEGNPAIAQGSLARRYPGIGMQGWTEQDSYEGKNLFDASKAIAGVLNAETGQADASSDYCVSDYVPVVPGAIYSRSDSGAVLNCFYSDQKEYISSNTGYTSIAVPENAVYMRFSMRNADVDTCMFNEGSTALPYEPYTGEQPSPNPDYPQEITSAGKYDEASRKYEYEVKLTGKNLWNAEEAADKSNWVKSTSQKGYSDFAIEVKPGEKVTFSFPEKLPLGIGMYVAIVSVEDGIIVKWLYHSTSESIITQQATITAITDKIWVRCNNGSIEKFVQDNPYFQVEYGKERTDFQPYKNQTVILTSDRPLTKWDRLEKRNGQWGWVYKSNMLSVPKAGYIAFDSLAKDRKYFTAVNLVPDIKISSNLQAGSQYCNICNFGNPYEHEGNLFWIYRYTENKNGDLRIGLSDTSIDTKELFEQYISDKDIYIWYETAEETFVPLSESEQEQMNALYTFRPATVLSNDCGCEMTLTYKTKKSLEVTT